jgi:hypothetical protein
MPTELRSCEIFLCVAPTELKKSSVHFLPNYRPYGPFKSYFKLIPPMSYFSNSLSVR